MKLGVNLAFRRPADVVESARAAAGYGFDWVGTVDSPLLFCDTTVASMLVALNTEQCRLGPVVTNPVSRRTEHLASALSSLHAVSGGRAALGLGSGDTAVANLGLAAASVAQMERAVAHFRSLSASADPEPGVASPIPVLLAAGGPRMTALAGRIADGVIFGSGCDPELLAPRCAAARVGAESAGRDPDELEIWVMGLVYLGPEASAKPSEDDEESDLRSLLAAFAHHSLSAWPGDRAQPSELQQRLSRLVAGYDTRHHLAERSPTDALVNELGLTEELKRIYLLPAKPPEIAQRFAALEALGVTGVMLSGTVGQRRRIVELYGRDVLPHLRATAS